jgi:hypothetical protein
MGEVTGWLRSHFGLGEKKAAMIHRVKRAFIWR